jgi:hypothetical protein
MARRDDGFQPLNTCHPILTQVEAPTLKKYGTSFFEKFMAKRGVYDANLNRKIASDPSVKFVATPLNNYIKKEVLEGICEYDLDWTVDSVTDEQLIEYFVPYLKVGGKAHFNLDSLSTDAAKLRFNMSEPDVKTRIKKLKMGYKAFLIRRSCPKLIANSPKFAVQHILAAVTSATLHAEVVSALEYEEAALKKDYTGSIWHLTIAYEPYISLSIVPKGSSSCGSGARNGGSGGSGGSGSSRNRDGGSVGGGSSVQNGARAGGYGGSGSFGGSDVSNGLGGSGGLG